MIFGKHINRYYLRFLPLILLGLASLIVVDYLQKIRGDRQRRSSGDFERVSQVSRSSGCRSFFKARRAWYTASSTASRASASLPRYKYAVRYSRCRAA